MSKNRLWTLGLSAAIVLVAIFGYLLGVAPILTQVSATELQRDSIVTSNQASEIRTAGLKAQFANMSTVEDQLDKLSVSIPSGPDMPVFLRELNTLTDQAGVVLGTVTVGDTMTYVPPKAATKPISDPPSKDTATPSADSATAADVPATPAGPSARLQLIPVQISVTGSYSAVMKFVGALQSGDRLYLANSLAVASSPEHPATFTGSLIGFVYALPTAAEANATATGTTTTGDAAAAPSK